MTGTHLDTTSLLGHPGLMQGRPSTRLTTITLHPVRRDEHQAVLDLVDADRLPGQPQAAPADLREALAGRSPIDGALWAGLTDLRHDVAVDSLGNVLGVIATGWRARDSTAVLTWMHARENSAVLSALLDAALARFSTTKAEAFGMATALDLGLEALPVSHRRHTADVLVAAGFASADLWNYMLLPPDALTELLDAPASKLSPALTSRIEKRRLGWRIAVHEGKHLVGEIEIDGPAQGISRIAWLEVDPGHRGAGLGRFLLRAGLGRARRAGAEQAVLYVDDDEPGTARDRTAATALYRKYGFRSIDRLHTFTRS
ncbi:MULTISPECIES: GNAT family N-acetyltransferase [Pseudonocardia]|uniref:Acetyltransferase (GNAT) family protein n=1 Tax=Pseudonocardia alni TaxID=33907 RepID=A0A852W9N1_PSEA5|nr:MULTISPECIES: GNAT family N-acetyltransferase [Pseudonocardia]MCO7192197.1 GNAT family N-acetyltransferase [Pseudonocardia sp. McavD-2-B]NYG05310.1 ribosomal protein S18 acetylase RimI-like enzyme [Pseudonocardia antarctica]PKB41340.1 acetyltransferase (GNAT) family protein [Pseudonocardia alni]